ncbi:histidinol-phosphate transaminase [Corynebacterium timonense]|uniref:Aromatic amino acid aminotransferase n=1 Tax=Corynebacterium timonense TaxID=441500 RepID=A0A1H1QRM6_9CORY|nr:histidinol-phosphate transaminase [Corynebacterium timonense]SDS26120.1 histidinol-phosphate aminotransferase [Corynebacterium timonense]
MIRPDLSDLPAYVPGTRTTSPDTVKLSSNESAEGPLPSVRETLAAASAELNRYPDMGALEVRAAIARHLQLNPERVAVGTGSSALCQQLVTATAQPGDEIVFPWRSFEAYPIFTRIAGATPIAVPLTADQRLDMPALAAAVTERTRVIFVCNPNNPSGTTITTGEWNAFIEAVPRDVIVALDEAYFEYNRASDTPVATEEIVPHPNVVGLRTFSKAYGLAGARIGYAFGAPEIIEALNKVAVPFSVSSVAQAAALASLEQQEELRRRVEATIHERDRFGEALADYDSPASQANFVWVPAHALDAPAAEYAQRLADHDVLVRAFDEGLRITVTTERETEAFLAAWRRVTGSGR